MFSNWPLGRQILASLILTTIATALFAVQNIRHIYAVIDAVALTQRSHDGIDGLERVLSTMTLADLSHRTYVLSGNEALLASTLTSTQTLEADLDLVATGFSHSPEKTQLVQQLRQSVKQELEVLRQSADARRTQGSEAALALLNLGGTQSMKDVTVITTQLRRDATELHTAREAEQARYTRRFTSFFAWGSLALLGVSMAMSTVVGSRVRRTLGTAIAQVQDSSSELQAAATQQASGAREQSSATTEISTTVKQLLSTARQIAASTQQLANVAGETAGAAGTGNSTVEQAQEAIGTVRRQVDAIVNHMLDLGKRSQEVGGILDIINELADQTNILAINATIESAGAGEHGRRFAVVAEEIRKLADRVAGATKDIRVLIDEIRAASNTTIMATEDGSKAVQSSAQQFSEVAGSFQRIAELVRTNLEVVREIEMSTQQQTTAVEQVNTAILEVAHTARQSEVSSTQTLLTANRLSELSQQLTAILETRAARPTASA